MTKKDIARKLLLQCSDLFDINQKTFVCRLSVTKMERKEISKGNYSCFTIQNLQGYTKINAQ